MLDHKPKPCYLRNQKIKVTLSSNSENIKAIIALAVFLGSLIAVSYIDKL